MKKKHSSEQVVTGSDEYTNVYAYIAAIVGHFAYYVMSRDHGLSQK